MLDCFPNAEFSCLFIVPFRLYFFCSTTHSQCESPPTIFLVSLKVKFGFKLSVAPSPMLDALRRRYPCRFPCISDCVCNWRRPKHLAKQKCGCSIAMNEIGSSPGKRCGNRTSQVMNELYFASRSQSNRRASYAQGCINSPPIFSARP
jgi:hypothetical protein